MDRTALSAPSNGAARRFVVPISFVIAIGLIGASPWSLVRARTPSSDVLLQAGHLRYLGAFRLPGPTGSGEQNTFGYGGEAMAYDPYRESLWITGHDWHDRLAEVTIPTPSLTNWPVASFKTSWIDMTWRNQVGGGSANMGGIFPLPNGDLILSAYEYYDASASQRMSHVRRRANGTFTSPVQVGGFGAGFVSGYMIPVPTAWQAALGGPALTGNSSLSIIGRTSLGPAAAVFNPDDVGRMSPVPATQVLGYPLNHPTLGGCETGTVAGEFNCGAANNRAGLVWPGGTRSILYFHRICAGGQVGYSGGYFCPRGRVTRVIAINADDLVAVREGRRQPWEVQPYASWNLGAPLASARLTAVTYDPLRKWIFLAEDHGDGTQPLIHVYEVDAAAAVVPSVPTTPGLSKSSDESSGAFRRSASRTGGSNRHAMARNRTGDREGDGDGERDQDREVRGDVETPSGGQPLRMSRRPLAEVRPSSAVREGTAREQARKGPAPPAPRPCMETNPFDNLQGLIGVCVDGAWRQVRGIRSSGMVRESKFSKTSSVWLIDTGAAIYEPARGLPSDYQSDGLAVIFEGHFTHQAAHVAGAVAIELGSLSLAPP